MVKKAFIALIFVSVLSIGICAALDEETKTIVETATDDGNFNTLIAAIEAAGLTDDLNGEGPFTVFAPTNVAFEAVEGLDMNDTEALAEMVTYHVVDGEYMAADVVNMTTIPTLQGGNLTVEVTDEGVMVDGANVTATDIVCSNGVIHVIDMVLMPPAEEEVEETEEMTEETVGETTVEVEVPEFDMADEEEMVTDEVEP
ncbi:MAG TPA: fasciclin domain-containing protein [Methanotrichaceae archaeon]|nr:fasciclin domain-containing protein [Methanotrichaceae archaeon]